MAKNNELGMRIKEARKAKGLKQSDLSKMLGLSKITISNYETGTISPPLSRIQSIADALKCTPGYLLGVKDSLVNEREARLLEKLYDAPEGPFQKFSRPYTAQEAVEKELARLKAEQRKKEMIYLFSQLNDLGKDEAVKRLEEMTMIPKYREDPEREEDESNGND